MSIDYTIAAIPTEYKGHKYRSRLEARWAAFMDLLNWRHEYEPFDLGKWSPDFQVVSDLEASRVLVEVKPISRLDKQTADKAVQACVERQLHHELSGVLIVGTNPVINNRIVQIGWVSRLEIDENPKLLWQPALLLWIPEEDRPGFRIDVPILNDDGVWQTLFQYECYDELPGPHQSGWYGEHTMSMWGQASNTVQWLGRNA